MHPNTKAFLDMIAFSEGTSRSPVTRHAGYDVIVTGADGKPEVFTDFSTHPFANGRAPKAINSKGLRSTASGRYQFLVRDWSHYKAQLGLVDFGPDSQDAWAIQMIKECRALALIEAGLIAGAINRCASRWASFPGAGYGQPEHALAPLIAAYRAAGGVVLLS